MAGIHIGVEISGKFDPDLGTNLLVCRKLNFLKSSQHDIY